MRSLMESWRRYERGVLSEALPDPELGISPPDAASAEAIRRGGDLTGLLGAATILNRFGLPSEGDIEYLRNLSDDDLADLNEMATGQYDHMDLEHVQSLTPEDVSRMKGMQAEQAAKILRFDERGNPRDTWDPDLMSSLTAHAVRGTNEPTYTREGIEEMANFQWSDLVFDPDAKVASAIGFLPYLGAGKKLNMLKKGFEMAGTLKKLEAAKDLVKIKKAAIAAGQTVKYGEKAKIGDAVKLRKASDLNMDARSIQRTLESVKKTDMDAIEAIDFAARNPGKAWMFAHPKTTVGAGTAAVGVPVATGVTAVGKEVVDTATANRDARIDADSKKIEAKLGQAATSRQKYRLEEPAAVQNEEGEWEPPADHEWVNPDDPDNWNVQPVQESLKRVIREEVIKFFKNREG
jgi:hypothetical protein